MIQNSGDHQRAVLLACMSFLLLLLTSCDGITHISGRVRDDKGKPIEGAKVNLHAGDRDNFGYTSRADGFYDTQIMHGPFNNVKVKLTVSKEGYKTYEQTFLSGEAAKQKVYDVTLEPLAPSSSLKQTSK